MSWLGQLSAGADEAGGGLVGPGSRVRLEEPTWTGSAGVPYPSSHLLLPSCYAGDSGSGYLETRSAQDPVHDAALCTPAAAKEGAIGLLDQPQPLSLER